VSHQSIQNCLTPVQATVKQKHSIACQLLCHTYSYVSELKDENFKCATSHPLPWSHQNSGSHKDICPQPCPSDSKLSQLNKTKTALAAKLKITEHPEGFTRRCVYLLTKAAHCLMFPITSKAAHCPISCSKQKRTMFKTKMNNTNFDIFQFSLKLK